jgi:hypothetical protein
MVVWVLELGDEYQYQDKARKSHKKEKRQTKQNDQNKNSWIRQSNKQSGKSSCQRLLSSACKLWVRVLLVQGTDKGWGSVWMQNREKTVFIFIQNSFSL